MSEFDKVEKELVEDLELTIEDLIEEAKNKLRHLIARIEVMTDRVG